VDGIQPVTPPVSPPRVRARHTPNFATSAAKLVCRASRNGVVRGQGLSHGHIELGARFEAILNFSPSLKVVISVPDRGVARPPPPINMSSERPAPTLQVVPLLAPYSAISIITVPPPW